ncbi:MAG: hypothetical protein Q9164_006791 [Protoblastenia rupestris]
MIFPSYTLLLAALAPLAFTKAIPADLNSLITRAPQGAPRRPRCPAGNPNPSYTVLEGDTARSISIARNVSTLNLMAVNSLKNETAVLEPKSNLCIPPLCKIYNVKKGNTCAGIAKAFGLTPLTRIFDHNPGIQNPECDNMEVGSNICLDKSRGSNFPMAAPVSAPAATPRPGSGTP